MPCYLVYTSLDVHDTLRTGFEDSPLFNGTIKGIGPRYCPSIEDKLRTFADKEQHQLFLEPEGRTTNEYYLNGFSSSLPYEVQLSALHQIKGMEGYPMFEYMTVQEAANLWEISERRIQKLCEEKRIDGVVRLSRVWLIPKDAKKPTDGRRKGNKSLQEKQTI